MATPTPLIAPAESFVRALEAGIDYWQERTRDLGDEGLGELDQERHNLYRAVHLGLVLPHTWEAAVEVVLRAVPLAERRVYWGEWIALLESILAQCPPDNRELRYRILIELGRLYNNSRRFQEALDVLDEAEGLARLMDERVALAKALYNLGRSYYEMRQYEQAKKYALAVKTTLEPAGGDDIWLVAEAEKILGHVARALGELGKSLVHMNRAVELWRPLGKQTELAKAIIDQGVTLFRMGDDEMALSRWQKALEILEPTGDLLDITLVKLNMVAIYHKREDWPMAERLLHEANSRWLRQSGHLNFQASIATNTTAVLLKQARWVEAGSYARQAIHLWDQLNDELNMANAIGSLGEALAGQGKAAEANEKFDQALALTARYPNQAFAQRLEKFFSEEKQKLKL